MRVEKRVFTYLRYAFDSGLSTYFAPLAIASRHALPEVLSNPEAEFVVPPNPETGIRAVMRLCGRVHSDLSDLPERVAAVRKGEQSWLCFAAERIAG